MNSDTIPIGIALYSKYVDRLLHLILIFQVAQMSAQTENFEKAVQIYEQENFSCSKVITSFNLLFSTDIVLLITCFDDFTSQHDICEVKKYG